MARPMSPTAIEQSAADKVADSARDRVERVYRNHAKKMWRALLAYSGDADVASDSLAEAFAQALRRGDAVHDVERWVWRTAFRIAAGELKKRRLILPEIDSPATDPNPDFELHNALMGVAPKQRAALFLHYYGGYPPGEIARMIGSTQSAVRVHLHRGRKRLAQILEGGSHA